MSYFLVVLCITVLLPQEAVCTTNYTLSVNLTTNSPLNCSAGLTHPGVFLTLEYRWVEGPNNVRIPSQWMGPIDRIIMEPTENEILSQRVLQKEIDITSLFETTNSTRLLQFRIVQPEHGGGACNCWGIGVPSVYKNGAELPIFSNNSRIFEPCPGNSARSSVTSNTDTDWIAFDVCGGGASTQRGLVYRPIRLTGNRNELRVSDSCIEPDVTECKGPPPINCSNTEPRIELSYEVMFGICDCIDNFNEGVEVSLGNWDNDGDWVPLVYHTSRHDNDLRTNCRTIRGYDVPYYIEPGVYSVSVCGERFLRDGFQIRWLQHAINASSDNLIDVITLDNVSVTVYANQTVTNILNEGFDQIPDTGNDNFRLLWKSDIRNGGISTDCNGSNSVGDNKIIFGLTCETFNCKSGESHTSRIATTVPLNISQFLESSNQVSVSNSTGSTMAPLGADNVTMVHLCGELSEPVFPNDTCLLISESLSGVTNDPMVNINSTATNSINLNSVPDSLSPTMLPTITATGSLITPSATISVNDSKQLATKLPTAMFITPSSSISASLSTSAQGNPVSVTVSVSPVPPSDPVIIDTETIEQPTLLTNASLMLMQLFKNEELLAIYYKELQKNSSLIAITTRLQEVVVTSDILEEDDVTAVVYLLNIIVNKINEVNDSELIGQTVLDIADILQDVSNVRNEPNTVAGSTLLATTEQLAFALGPNNSNISSENIELVVQEIGEESSDLYISGVVVDSSSIQVPSELVKELTKDNELITMASVYYRNMSGLLPGTLPGESDSVLASPVVSASLQCGQSICDTARVELTSPVVVTLKHSIDTQAQENNEETVCVFWEFLPTERYSLLVSGSWNTSGCRRNASLSNSTQTVCECTHLTNFAILLSTQPLVGGASGLVLELISYIGVGLSVLAMLLTITLLIYLKSLWNMNTFVHINLCVSLILAQLTFVIGVTPHEGGGSVVGPGCQTAAVLMHYLFLVSFMWMLMEGVVLYVVLVKVFVTNPKSYMIGFFLFSYVAPLLYMVVCVPLGFLLYPEEDHHGYGYIHHTNETVNNVTVIKETTLCWLNPHNNFILMFIVPVVLVVMINIGFFIMTLVIMARHSKRIIANKTQIQKTMYWLKSSVSLVTVMGLTWITGVLVFEVPALFPLAYIFTIFVAFQGVAIFLFFVPLNKQVREAYSKWWKGKVAKSEFLSRHFSDNLSYNSHNQLVAVTAKKKLANEEVIENVYQLESSPTAKLNPGSKTPLSENVKKEKSPIFSSTLNEATNTSGMQVAHTTKKKSNNQATEKVYQLESSTTKPHSDSKSTIESSLSLDGSTKEESPVFSSTFHVTFITSQWNTNSENGDVCIKNNHTSSC